MLHASQVNGNVTAVTTPVPPQIRRPFAARREHKGWGWGLVVLGALMLLGSLTSSASSSPVTSVVLGLAMVAVGVYLLRGRVAGQKVAGRKTELAAAGMQQATAALATARGGEAVVAYRNLWATARRFHHREATDAFNQALGSINFDPARLNSTLLGVVEAAKGCAVEIYRDWIIYGQEAHDVDASVRGDVYVDGSVQVSSVAVPKGKNGKKVKIVEQTHDTRSAQLQLASTAWSLSVQIKPDQVNEARRILGQLTVQIESLRPRGATVSDIEGMVEAILNNAGQPPAEKLRQLSDLRYDRLLSDEEFEATKAKILGI